MTFPPLSRFDDAELARLGYRPLHVSVFDHWLSEAEAAACAYISRQLAEKRGALDAYAAGESRFLSLYHGLVLTGACDVDGPLSPVAAERIIRASLREEALMDIRFPEFRVRVVGGWDRTDLFLLEPGADLPALTARVTRAGLHLLP